MWDRVTRHSRRRNDVMAKRATVDEDSELPKDSWTPVKSGPQGCMMMIQAEPRRAPSFPLGRETLHIQISYNVHKAFRTQW